MNFQGVFNPIHAHAQSSLAISGISSINIRLFLISLLRLLLRLLHLSGRLAGLGDLVVLIGGLENLGSSGLGRRARLGEKNAKLGTDLAESDLKPGRDEC